MIDNALDYEGLKHYNGKSKEYIDNSDALLKQTIGVSHISKNLIPFPYYDDRAEVSGITFSIDDYGRVTLNGTSTANIYFYLIDNKVFENALLLPNDNFTLTGCPSGGSDSTYRLGIVKNVNGTRTVYKNDYGSGATFSTVNDGNTRYDVTIYVAKGATLNNIVFEPMLRLASIKDASFKPYMPSLKTLIDSNVKDVMVGASSTTDGNNGLVPVPNKGEQDKFLKGDGTWCDVNATTLNGKSLLNYDATDTWEGIPYISSRGIMEVGGRIDFHITDGNTNDYDARIVASAEGLSLSGKTNLAVATPLRMVDSAGIEKGVIGLHNPTPDTPSTVGSEFVLNGTGNAFIGSGEAGSNLRNVFKNRAENTTVLDEQNYSPTNENLYIASDGALWLYSNCNTKNSSDTTEGGTAEGDTSEGESDAGESISNRRGIVFNRTGMFYPIVDNEYILGKSTHKWKNINTYTINGYTLAAACARGVKTLSGRGNSGFGTNNDYLIDTTFISRWNGAYDSEGKSNLEYCNRGAFGTAVTRNVDTTPTDSSSNLITSGAMYSALASKLSTTDSAASATKIYSTSVTPAGEYYNISFHADKDTSGNKSLLNNNGFTVRIQAGSTSTEGFNCLVLGNELAAKSAGGAYGAINIFGKTTYRTQITAGSPSENRNIALPNSSGTLSVTSSDVRLKENIKDTEEQNALSVVNSIKFRQFDWKESGKHQKIGVIADELEVIDEHLVLENTGGYYEETDEDGNSVMNVKCVDTFYLMGYYGKAIQELSVENTTLREEIKELKNLVSTLINK